MKQTTDIKKILYLTFYFEPDLSACSFRNTPLVKELAEQAGERAHVEVLTTLPNRYSSSHVKEQTQAVESHENYTVRRFAVPENSGGMKSQIQAYQAYFRKVRSHARQQNYDLVVASSAKLFTGYLASTIAKKQNIPLYLDIRDLFHENLDNMLREGLVKKGVLPAIKTVEKKTFSRADHINLISPGFKPNFEEYPDANYSFFTNGIDDLFLHNKAPMTREPNGPWRIVYAGNMGEGQGLHKIIPQAAKDLGEDYRFIVIGDGGKKQELIDRIHKFEVTNVELRDPVNREELIGIYADCDFSFVHLNDYDAFKKVLPSKIFELACFPQPMIAGVGGYAREFIAEHVENSILFDPCNADQLVDQLKDFDYRRTDRQSFKEKFKRTAINKAMAGSMLRYL